MRKIVLSIAIFWLACFSADAQDTLATQYNDRVKLVNGSIFYGKLRHYNSNDTVLVELATGGMVRFHAHQIQSMRMAKPPRGARQSVEKPYHFREKGLYGTFAYANSFGKSANDARIGVGAAATVGWQFHRLLGAGAGVSYDQMYIRGGDAPVWSFFGEVRSYFRAKSTTEYVSLAGGLSQTFKLKNDLFAERYAGFMVQPTVGYRFGASSRYNFFIDAGARFQRIGYLTLNRWSENKYTITYQRWILRGGLVF